MSYKHDLIYLNTVTDIKTRDQLREFVQEDQNYFIYIRFFIYHVIKMS